jgi:hypothetical protein
MSPVLQIVLALASVGGALLGLMALVAGVPTATAWQGPRCSASWCMWEPVSMR